ncbi:uncharacterized protein LOC122244146 isoform X2 [Penaeus japonicus]|uniref:uncharacterized protein LOC122244146 isoform X2 n=1 Tax=Penaeus japonicus TaxID=27405 RepID=UPI001C70C0BD|nr:uncharacterized protein LOC122244146 isoform X2 [Penaeus japonicus]
MRRPCTKVNMGEGRRAAAFLLTSCLVAFGVSLVGCEAPPAGVVEGLAGPLARDVSATDGRTPSATQGSERVTKREVREEGGPASECLEVEVLTNKTFQPVKIVRQLHYTFFLRPRPEFIDIKFNMMIDNLWNLALPYESSEAVVFSRADVEEEAERQAWVQITVEYFKHEVKNGRDKHGLRITVGNVTRQMISSRWWRTHAFEGFLVSARGPAKLLFDCPPQELVSPVPARLMNTPVLLGGILVLAFLVVVVPWMCFVYRRRANADLDEGPEVPPLPKSLLLEKGKVSKCPDQDNVYEEFDEDTLSRLRQKLYPQNLRGEGKDAPGDAPVYHHYEKLGKPRPLLRQKAVETKEKSGAPPAENYYENAPTMSLREEKEKLRKEDRQRSLSESHYVEMHGILNRRSFDFSKEVDGS